MNKTKVLSAWTAAVLAAAVAAAPARATLIDVTWSGSVLDGNDVAHAFGGAQDLTGLGFSASYRFDTTLGSTNTGATFADLRGGSQFGGGTFASPAVSATLTINGVTVAFGSDLFGGYSRQGGAGVSDIYTEVQSSNVGGGVDILFLREFRLDDNIPFAGLTETLSQILGNAGDTIQGFFQQFDDGTGSFLFSGHLLSTLVTIAPVVDTPPDGGGDGVPEPATIALLGMALVGLGLERRRRRAA